MANQQIFGKQSSLFLVPRQRPAQCLSLWRRMLEALDLQPEDLLAIPLCLLLGFALSVYSMGTGGVLQAVQTSPVVRPGHADIEATVCSLLSVPAAAVRQWFS